MADIFPIDQARAGAAAPSPGRRKLRWPRILLWSACILAVVALVAASAGVIWLHSAAKAALPVLDGDLHVAGLSAPVIVLRDAHGVPHIEAASQDDLLIAQGYVTAQDRLWQMDAYRRNAEGTLAEIMGSSLVEHDKAQRVMQFKNSAQRIYDHLLPADRARVDNYAHGVNLFIEQHQDSLPAEFRLLHYRPQPWTGVDSVSVGLMIVEMLDTHWPNKLARERVSADLNNPGLESDLYPVGSWRDHPPTGLVIDLSQPHPELAPPNSDDDDDDEPSSTQAAPHQYKTPNPALQAAGVNPQALLALMGLPACDGCVAGSNNWVIAGRHTASGKPMLSNDMHLVLMVPNIWYMADLRAPGLHAAGVTIPGMPLVIEGHNEHVAWGITALMGDADDLYLEKLDGKGNYQDADGTWKPMTVDHEVIKVRGGKDVILNVEITGHGPLLNPILPKESRPIALKWTLLDPTLNALPIYQLNTAQNWTEFSSALASWCWPTLNMVYADDQGHIAYHAVGRVPIRPGGLAGKPINDSAHEWQGYIPFDDMPNSVDPPSGFLATANSRVTTDKSPYPLTLEWVEPYRTERIYKTLEGRDGLTPKDMLAVQTDVYSEMDQEMGQRLSYAIDHTEGVDERLRKAADLMRSWDGRLTTDSVAASVVTTTRQALWPMILEPKLSKDAAAYRWEESNFAEEEIVMHARADWLPSGYKNWDALLTAAVRKGMDNGKAPADVTNWHYGSWHVVDLEHPLARYLPLVGRIAGTGPHPLSGDTTTVKQVNISFGPSQRFTIDWSDVDGSTQNIVLGESGDPLSPWFRDQWNDWYGGTTFPLPFSPAAVAAQTKHTLRLLP
jgi:penicillin amidase